MNVYYNGNFWSENKREQPGTKIPIGKWARWGETRLWIPAVYCCDKGLTADLCILVERGRIEAFLNKWTMKKRRLKLTGEEMEQIEKDNPLSLDFKAAALVNGKRLSSSQSCSVSWIPFETEELSPDPAAMELLEAYGCDKALGWQFIRISFPWASQKPEITSLTLLLSQPPVPCSGDRFVTGPDSVGKTFPLVHPVEKTAFALKVCSFEAKTMEEGSFPQDPDMEFPSFYHMMSYRLSPDPGEKHFRLFDCAEGDKPRNRRPDSKASSLAAAVGIIFGADGQTERASLPPLSYAASALSFTPAETVEWRPVFYTAGREAVQICLLE